jgi:hypothetical protein
MSSQQVTRRGFISRSLLVALGAAGIGVGFQGGGSPPIPDPLSVLKNPPAVPQTILHRPLIIVDDNSSDEINGALEVDDPATANAVQIFNSQGNVPQLRMAIDPAETRVTSFLNWVFANTSGNNPGHLGANLFLVDPNNFLGLGAGTVVIGDDGTLNGISVPKLMVWTDPAGSLDFSKLGSGGVTPLANGADVSAFTAPAATAGKPVGTGHSHNNGSQFQVGAYFENSGGTSTPPVRIARWKNVTKAITARRLSVLAQNAPAGGSDVYELTDLTTTLQVTLAAGATEAETSALTTRNFVANSILYFRLASSTATTQAQKINLIADYTMNG